MPRRKSKRGGVALGFILTFGVLSILAVALLESNTGVTVVQVPDKLPTYSGVLQGYVPTDALQVSLDNLTAIRAINRSVDRKSTRLNSSHPSRSRMPSSA